MIIKKYETVTQVMIFFFHLRFCFSSIPPLFFDFGNEYDGSLDFVLLISGRSNIDKFSFQSFLHFSKTPFFITRSGSYE